MYKYNISFIFLYSIQATRLSKSDALHIIFLEQKSNFPLKKGFISSFVHTCRAESCENTWDIFAWFIPRGEAVCFHLFFRLIDHINFSRCQFHQHYTRAFFVRTLFWQLISSYMYVEKRRLYKKFVQKMLIKLTAGGNPIKEISFLKRALALLERKIYFIHSTLICSYI